MIYIHGEKDYAAQPPSDVLSPADVLHPPDVHHPHMSKTEKEHK
jgi:hypothetical protein